MNADDLSRRIVVRHREDGHLRFELPAEICHDAAAAAITRSLYGLAGVYRVRLTGAQRRLVVRFDAHACGAGDVARALKALLVAGLPAAASGIRASADARAIAPPSFTRQALATQARRLFARLQGGIGRLREVDAPAGSLQAKLGPVLGNALTERAITNFLNDLVAFYLIKAHWEMITQRWLKDPVKYGNAWLTTFYLVFLLVRYRKSAARAASAGQVAQ